MDAIRRFIRRSEGGALVELAVSLPILVMILAGTVDFARVFNMSVSLTNAARAGAQYGAYSVANSGDTATMQTTATSSTNISGVAANASRTCMCATDAGVFSATSPSANNCSAAASVACPTGHVVITVTVTTSKTFSTLMSVLPGVPSSINLVRSATLRVVN